MFLTFRVRVVARFRSDVQVLDRATHTVDVTSAPPDWDTSAVDWNTTVGPPGPLLGTDLGRTLTVIYEAEGRTATEAARFARAIFECEWKRAEFPPPIMLAVFPEEAPA
jgi:hypothetical protein